MGATICPSTGPAERNGSSTFSADHVFRIARVAERSQQVEPAVKSVRQEGMGGVFITSEMVVSSSGASAAALAKTPARPARQEVRAYPPTTLPTGTSRTQSCVTIRSCRLRPSNSPEEVGMLTITNLEHLAHRL